MKTLNQLIVSKEDLNEDPSTMLNEIPDQTELEIIGQADELEGIAGEIGDLVSSMEDAVQDVAVVEDIVDVAQMTVESGEGMTRASSEMATIAIEALYTRLGIDAPACPSVEAFGGTGDRVNGTKLAIEGWQQNIKKVWEAIKKAMTSAWKKIKEFFIGFFNNTAKMTSFATALKATIDSKKGSGIKNAEVTTTATSAFNVDGKLFVHEVFSNHFAVTQSSVKMVEVIAHMVTDLNQNIRTAGKGGAVFASFSSHASSLASTSSHGISQSRNADGSMVFGPFVNDSWIHMSIDPEQLSMAITMANTGKKGPDKAPTLSRADAVKLCDDVIMLMKSTESYRKVQDRLDGIHSALIGAVESVITLASKLADTTESNAKVKETINDLRKVTTSLNAFTTKFNIFVPVSNMKIARAALNYVSASISQYQADLT